MKKPSWLKKDFSDKPWKYPIKMDNGRTIITYNFRIPVEMKNGAKKTRDAIRWIDEQMEKKILFGEKSLRGAEDSFRQDVDNRKAMARINLELQDNQR